MSHFFNKLFSLSSKEYGRIYSPYYSPGEKMASVTPNIYNKFGVKMDVFF